MKRLNLDLDDELHQKFKAKCAEYGKDMTEIITRFIQEFIKDGTLTRRRETELHIHLHGIHRLYPWERKELLEILRTRRQ